MLKVILLMPAKRDLAEIYDYILAESRASEIASSFLSRLTKRINEIRDFPNIGIKRKITSKQYQVVVFEKYNICYKITKDFIKIYRVIHSARNLKSVF